MKKHYPLLWLLALVRLMLPFGLQNGYYQPHRDEFLYLNYAAHMDWGYMEVPPLLSVFSWLTRALGNGFFWVKFWPALFGALTFLLCGDLIIRHKGGRLALFILFISFFFGAFLTVFFLFQPGFLEIFFWTAISYCLVRFQQSEDVKWLYAFGVACGLGMLSKYTTAFFLSGVLLAILLTPQRTLFTNRHFYLAGIIGFLLFLPNLLWQYYHNFPIVFHMKELRETQLVHMDAAGFIGGQIVMNLVVILAWLGGLIAVFSNRHLTQYRWIGFAYFMVLGLLMAGSGKDYYALGVYPVLFGFGALWLEKITLKWSLPAKAVLLGLPVLAGLFIVPIAMPVFRPEKLVTYYEKTGFRNALGFKWEDQQNHPLPQDFADMMGWREIAEMTAKNYHQLPDSTKAATVIYCRGYFTAGALNYFGKKLGLPESVSDNGSYLQWMPSDFNFKHLMLIGHQNPGSDDVVFNHFAGRRLMDSINMPLFRENGMKIFFFENGSDSMRYYANEGLRQQKAKFIRKK
jgi:hypothetical protein